MGQEEPRGLLIAFQGRVSGVCSPTSVYPRHLLFSSTVRIEDPAANGLHSGFMHMAQGRRAAACEIPLSLRQQARDENPTFYLLHGAGLVWPHPMLPGERENPVKARGKRGRGARVGTSVKEAAASTPCPRPGRTPKITPHINRLCVF